VQALVRRGLDSVDTDALRRMADNVDGQSLRNALRRANGVDRKTLQQALSRGFESVDPNALLAALRDVAAPSANDTRRLAARPAKDARKLAGRTARDARKLASTLPSAAAADAPKPALFGVGFGGLAILAGGAVIIYRLLRGGSQPDPYNWNAGGE
jgi:hypothetical protein